MGIIHTSLKLPLSPSFRIRAKPNAHLKEGKGRQEIETGRTAPHLLEGQVHLLNPAAMAASYLASQVVTPTNTAALVRNAIPKSGLSSSSTSFRGCADLSFRALPSKRNSGSMAGRPRAQQQGTENLNRECGIVALLR